MFEMLKKVCAWKVSSPAWCCLLALILSGCRPSATAPEPESPGGKSLPAAGPAVEPLAPDADFVDISQKAGLNFQWTHSGKGPWTDLETVGCGCAFLDYDHDGWMDILLVGRPRCALYHNNHDGTFTDVTERAGLTREGVWQGVAVGDYDNDGYEDLYISGYHCGMLLHNNRNGTFSDVTEKAGLKETQWGSCCAFFDADGDGKLDLIVGHYVQTGPPYPWLCRSVTGVMGGCLPQVYPAQFPKLYHNRGDGRFVDATHSSGLDQAHGKALAIQFLDYDNDGKMDIYFANDEEPGDMFHNLGGGRFENVAAKQGTAFNMDGTHQAGMGVDCADYNRDGRTDLVVTAFLGEGYSLYQNLGGAFNVSSVTAGIGVTHSYLGFGVKFFDFNDDGWPDLVFANGHIFDNASQIDPRTTFRQLPLLFRNEGGRFNQVKNAGPGLSQPIVGRGLAVGDVENDGSRDLLVVDYMGHPLLLHNQRRTHNHWLGLKLEGTRSNRDGYGARVTVKWAGGQTVTDCTAAGSYCSSMDPRLHFGLGTAATVSEIDVRWPSARVSKLRNIAVDRYVTIQEPAQAG